MVLGSQIPSITYPMSLYYSGKAYGIRYIRGSLTIDPGVWDEADNKFLANDLFGLTYERRLPTEGESRRDKWDNYLGRIWDGLKEKRAAVQICQGWVNVTETENHTVIGPEGEIPWWEGMQSRPDMHYLTAVGMIKGGSEEGMILNDPIAGWFGVERDLWVPQSYFELMIKKCRLDQHRYITIVYYYPRAHLPVDPIEANSNRKVESRITAKIRGESWTYEDAQTWQEFMGEEWEGEIIYGANGLYYLHYDLEDPNFKTALLAREFNIEMSPLDTVSYLDLSLYHYAEILNVGAEFLEEQDRREEWEWTLKLHILYKRMWISTSYIRDVFKQHYLPEPSDDALDAAVAESEAYRATLRSTIDETIEHLLTYEGCSDLVIPSASLPLLQVHPGLSHDGPRP